MTDRTGAKIFVITLSEEDYRGLLVVLGYASVIAKDALDADMAELVGDVMVAVEEGLAEP